MRKLFAAIVAALVLAGCSWAEGPAPVGMSESADTRFDTEFVKQYTETIGTAPTVETVQAARDVGKITCTLLDKGYTKYQVAQQIAEATDDKTTQKIAATAAGIGIAVYCPKYV